MTRMDLTQRSAAELVARRAGIDTYQSPIVYMRADCAICRSEGFEAQARVEIEHGARTLIATVHHVLADWLAPGEAALSEGAWRTLALEGGELLSVRHPPVLESERHIRAKVYGVPLDAGKLRTIMQDAVSTRLSDLHLASFVTACAGDRMSVDETVALTRSMVEVGERLSWPQSPVMDKHCVGGLPGNRTTPLVVAIVTACGLVMPKTSSRAITSPAGTADAMETLAPVDLDLASMRRVVERVGGCIVWGGAVQLSPADDVLIRVERPLDLDGSSQLVASVLSKKVAAGSQRVVIDIPVGPTAKVRSDAAATELSALLDHVAGAVGLSLRIVRTDGTQPVGRGIGPALEARDVLAVLQRDPRGPADLRERALMLAGHVLELGGHAAAGQGIVRARQALDSGRAWDQFLAICEAQGGLHTPPVAPHVAPFLSTRAGIVAALDNRKLAMVAKLAGAPASKAAGITLDVKPGERIERGQPLLHLHAQTAGELAYARAYALAQELFTLEDPP